MKLSKKTKWILGSVAFIMIVGMISSHNKRPEQNNALQAQQKTEAQEQSEQFDTKDPKYCDLLRLDYVRAFSTATEGVDIYEVPQSQLVEVQQGVFDGLATREGISTEQLFEICPAFLQIKQ